MFIPFVWPLWAVAFSIALIVYSHCIRLHWMIFIALLKIKKKCTVVLCNFKLFADLLYCDFKVYVSQQSAYRCATPCIERITKIFGGLPFNCTGIQSPLTKHLFCKSYILNVVCWFHFQKTRVWHLMMFI